MDEVVDFDNLDKLVNLVGKPTPTLTVKHIVSLTRQNPRSKNPKDKLGYVFPYEVTPNNRYVAPTNGLAFTSMFYIQLVGTRTVTDDKGETQTKVIRCNINPQCSMTFLAALDNVYSWLAGPKYATTFILDASRRPLKIADPFQKETCPLTQTSYIAFKPAIIRDASDVRYEGIAMGTQDGEMTNFVAPEFAWFRSQMQFLLPNLYTASCSLVSQAMQYCIYKNMEKYWNGKR